MTIILLSQLQAFLVGHGHLSKISIRYTYSYIHFIRSYITSVSLIYL